MNTSNLTENLDFTYSNHAVLSYDQSIGKDFRIKVETYYQYIDNAPIQIGAPDNYSLLNYGTSFGVTSIDSLINEGLGHNYGVELTVEKFFTKGYYFLITASLFQSEYQGADKVWYNTAFNSNYVANALGGYEVKIGKKKNLALAFNLKLTVAGGRRYTPIDWEVSNIARNFPNFHLPNHFLRKVVKSRTCSGYLRRYFGNKNNARPPKGHLGGRLAESNAYEC